MIQRDKGHKIIEAPIGFYNIGTNEFLVVEPVHLDLEALGQNGPLDPEWLILDPEPGDYRETETYNILYTFTSQDIADCLSLTFKKQTDKIYEILDNIV